MQLVATVDLSVMESETVENEQHEQQVLATASTITVVESSRVAVVTSSEVPTSGVEIDLTSHSARVPNPSADVLNVDSPVTEATSDDANYEHINGVEMTLEDIRRADESNSAWTSDSSSPLESGAVENGYHDDAGIGHNAESPEHGENANSKVSLAEAMQ
jgi:hypothetical protein